MQGCTKRWIVDLLCLRSSYLRLTFGVIGTPNTADDDCKTETVLFEQINRNASKRLEQFVGFSQFYAIYIWPII